VYLAKLTAANGGQSYLPFIVRSPKPSPLTVVVPTMTWQAYNDYGGADLYGWKDGPHPRAFEVSYGRPFAHEYGAGLFFRLDFPLIAWLEDHGYDPGYVADVDLARDPFVLDGVKTLAFSGHSEYWTASMRNDVDRAELAGVNVAFFGANQAFWQVRLATDAERSGSRLIICYKSAYLDPITPVHPALATSRFEEPPVNRPPSQLMGLKYGGIVAGIGPMILGPEVGTFAPETGLLAGQALPGLIGDEVDTPAPGFKGAILGATTLEVQEHLGPVIATAALWIRPGGGRVFDAGTFDFSWVLDPRYAASLPGFPAEGFSRLTAEILGWLGTQPTT
jgi:hypothetical protein